MGDVRHARWIAAVVAAAMVWALVAPSAGASSDEVAPDGAIFVGAEGETIRALDGEIRLIRTPNGTGCTGVWWSIVDDLPRAVDFEVTVNRVSGAAPGPSTHNFNKFSTSTQFDGTAFDFDPGPGKVAHPFASAGTTGGCETDFIQGFELAGIQVTEYTVPEPEPGEAAFELESVPTGGNGRGCQTFIWQSVPEIDGAREYTTERLASTSGDPARTVEVLAPEDFVPEPSANSLDVGPYDVPDRLGDFVLTTARTSGGCPWLE